MLFIALGAGWLWLRNSQTKGFRDTPDPPLPLVGEGDNVWLLGDSMAVGLWNPLAALAKDSNVTLHVTAKLGAPTRWGLGKAQTVTTPLDLWLMCLGTNDVVDNHDDAIQAAKSIHRTAIEKGASLVILVPPDGGALEGHNDYFDMLQRVGTCILPPPNLQFASDNIHLTPNGYTDWAKHIWNTLLNME